MRRVAMAAFAFGACSPSPPTGLPCGPNGECPSGQSCDLASNTCDGDGPIPGLGIWKDDSAADFTANGAVLDQVAVEPGGFVAPIPYFTGGVLVSGIAGDQIPDPDTAKFDMILGQNPIVDRTLIRTLDIDYGLLAPLGVGITATDGFTIAVEGELELDAVGLWGFDLDADDRGFIDFAPPGEPFKRLIADGNGAPTAGTIDVTTPGWYRFRAMFADASGAAAFRLRANRPGPSGGLQNVPTDQMRVRVDAVPGVVIDGFEEAFCLDDRGSVRVDVLDQTYGPDPFGLLIGIGSYTVRNSTQLLIDTEGDYAFRIETLQGHRAWLDGQSIVDNMTTAQTTTITTPVHLVAGWHDLVVDVHKKGGTGNPSLAFTIDSGPVTGAIAGDHLRPVAGRDARITATESNADQPLAEGASVTKTVTVTLPTGFVADRIDVDLEVTHTAIGTISEKLVTPTGTTIDLAAAGDLTVDPTAVIRNVGISNLGAAWSFTATDNDAIDGATGTVTFAAVTMIGRRGVGPFDTSYRYESAVHELGDVVELLAMTWTVRQGDTSAVAMQLRTCDTADDCVNQPWTDVAIDSVPGAPVRRFAQYGATVTTNGDVPTALDAVELRYKLPQ